MMDSSQQQLQQEQGALNNCVYCSMVRPDIDGKCPVCHGSVTYFREAQMMDRESSSRMILEIMNEIDLSDFHQPEEIVAKRDKLISLLEDIVLYDFDIRSALITRIRDLDNELGPDIDQ